MSRGFFGVAVYHPKTEVNIGTLWRSAYLFGAKFMATIGRRYKTQASDTYRSTDHIPLFHYDAFEDFRAHLPDKTLLIAVELVDGANALETFSHPERAVYLLGAEDHGIPQEIMSKCHRIIKIGTPMSLNVAVAGSVVMYDRHRKITTYCDVGVRCIHD